MKTAIFSQFSKSPRDSGDGDSENINIGSFAENEMATCMVYQEGHKQVLGQISRWIPTFGCFFFTGHPNQNGFYRGFQKIFTGCFFTLYVSRTIYVNVDSPRFTYFNFLGGTSEKTPCSYFPREQKRGPS